MRRLPERSRLDLIAVDDAPVAGRWRPGSTLLFAAFGAVVLWIAVLAFCMALLR